MLNIYFAGAIRGGRDDAQLYAQLVTYLKTFGTVLTEHVGDEGLLQEEKSLGEEQIFQRDMQWLKAADLVIAEVSTPSLGVGYEIGLAQAMGKQIFCLYRPGENRRLSAMIAGNPALQVGSYTRRAEAEKLLAGWIEQFRSNREAGSVRS
ncbi:MAG: nucleoside 2-deoxyribosyltransferase [Proteobacteria bacterium]|nr:nucleoside 2-deoxyribosyltransferase [Pseudomonadota bacterium]MBU4295508.1 nucleoside 2-deoxyribosyltransferase [Pseudomonadota bacterium]MCG2749491.1 nucleoside 2-deoxyribosyltransferase [Desulfobulbaceae bacterium]